MRIDNYALFVWQEPHTKKKTTKKAILSNNVNSNKINTFSKMVYSAVNKIKCLPENGNQNENILCCKFGFNFIFIRSFKLKHIRFINSAYCGVVHLKWQTRYKITVNYIKAVWLNRKWCFISNNQPYRALIDWKPTERTGMRRAYLSMEITVHFWNEPISFNFRLIVGFSTIAYSNCMIHTVPKCLPFDSM